MIIKGSAGLVRWSVALRSRKEAPRRSAAPTLKLAFSLEPFTPLRVAPRRMNIGVATLNQHQLRDSKESYLYSSSHSDGSLLRRTGAERRGRISRKCDYSFQSSLGLVNSSAHQNKPLPVCFVCPGRRNSFQQLSQRLKWRHQRYHVWGLDFRDGTRLPDHNTASSWCQ